MARACTICTHASREAIDRALLDLAPNRRVATRYGVTEQAVRRHRASHLKDRMIQAAERREDADIRTAIDVIAQLRAINAATIAVLRGARRAKDGELALKAIDRIQRQIELQAKLIGELQPEGTTNISINADWLAIRTVIVGALASYPEARHAVAGALQTIDRGDAS